MKERIKKFMRRPTVAHLLAATERFGKRLGPQFAGAVTYFSVLSMVPVLMFAVSVLGLFVTVLNPDLMPQVTNLLKEQLGDSDATEAISTFVLKTLESWSAIALTALLAAAYSGSNWVKNLKHAVRTMWRDKFSEAATTGNFFVEIIENLMTFFGLLLSVAVAVGVTAAGQAFPEQIIKWLGLAHVPGISILLTLVSLVVSLIASWLLFAFLFIVLPGEHVRRSVWLKATIAGAVLITALQQLAGVIVSLLQKNRAAGVFGPIIILMLVFNILATIILMIAAWVGTADTWEAARAKKDADKAAGVADDDEVKIDEDDSDPAEHTPALSAATLAARDRAQRWAARVDPDDLRAVNYDPERVALPDPDATVSEENAARGVRVGLGVGYGVGAATGIGVGAAIVALVRKITQR